MQRVRLVLFLSVFLIIGLMAAVLQANTNNSVVLRLPFIFSTDTGQATGCVIKDEDGNPSTTGDRSPQAGWTLYLTRNGQRQEPAQQTGADGCATWPGLIPGYTYGLEQVLPTDWRALNGTSFSFGTATPGTQYGYAFVVAEQPKAMVEFRGLWVTRFDWATCCNYNQAEKQARIDQIVDDAANAGFNVLLFQVRGEADAFYTPGLEPWSRLLAGNLGQNPGWDPLARLIDRAHARGLKVHAYMNAYPVWLGCAAPPDGTSPRHFYYALRDHHGTSAGKLNGLQWDPSGNVICSGDYQRATPASGYVDDHLLAVAKDLVSRYGVDGIHLDHIRYAAGASCDPVSQAASGVPCFQQPPANFASYADWQRAQINGTIGKFYDQVVPLKPGLWLSAAVWPIYRDYWGWGIGTGYDRYFQDSKAWVQGGYIHSIMPMIYGSSYWNQTVWETLVKDFQASRGEGYIVPGIGSNHYSSFADIEARIQMARSIGTAGHAIFSYGGLKQMGYFDDLAAGPYAQPAVVPTISRRR